MARQQGTYKLASNIEPRAAAPLDAREKVALKNDLTAVDTFPYPYEGMEVYVVEEKKKYVLIGDDPTVSENWQEVGSGGGSLNELEDVNIVNPVNSQILKYNAINGKWINSELTGEYPEIVLSDGTGRLYIEIRNAFCTDKTKTGNKDNCNVFSITVQNRDENAIYDRTYLLYCHSFYTGSLSIGTAKALMLLDGSIYFPEDYDSGMTGIYINRASNIVYIKQRSGASNTYITVRQIAGIKSDNLSVSTVSSASGGQVENAFLNPVRTDYDSGIELVNGRIGIQEACKNPTFLGAQEEWDELSTSEKTRYKYANITDDESDPSVVVDAVTDGDMHAVTSNAVYNELKKVQSQTYEGFGHLINSNNNEINGYGHVAVTLENGIAEIKFSARISANNNPSTFNWGFNRDLLRMLIPALPNITPISSYSNLQYFSGTGVFLTDLMGYSGLAVVADQFWTPARMYQTDGTIGSWGSDQFPINSYITGTVYGTYTV